jgi:hypothetical protein
VQYGAHICGDVNMGGHTSPKGPSYGLLSSGVVTSIDTYQPKKKDACEEAWGPWQCAWGHTGKGVVGLVDGWAPVGGAGFVHSGSVWRL